MLADSQPGIVAVASDAAFLVHGDASPLSQPVCGPYAYFAWLAISGIKRKAAGILVDLSGQIPFAHAMGDQSTRGLFANRTAPRSRGLSQALLTVASAARHKLLLHASRTDSV
jgi:hypothetical protein